MESLTISVACYKDDGNLTLLLTELTGLYTELSAKYDLHFLFVDDGSKDQSVSRLENFCRDKENCEIHVHAENQGFGTTFKEVFTLPKTDWVFFNTGDYQFPAKNFFLMQQEMHQADIILGERLLRNDNWKRKLNSKVYNGCVSLFMRQKVKDVNSILLFKSAVFETIHLKGNSAFVNAEFLLKADRQGYRIKTTTIEHRERLFGKGSGGKWSVIIPTMIDFIKYLVIRKN